MPYAGAQPARPSRFALADQVMHRMLVDLPRRTPGARPLTAAQAYADGERARERIWRADRALQDHMQYLDPEKQSYVENLNLEDGDHGEPYEGEHGSVYLALATSAKASQVMTVRVAACAAWEHWNLSAGAVAEAGPAEIPPGLLSEPESVAFRMALHHMWIDRQALQVEDVKLALVESGLSPERQSSLLQSGLLWLAMDRCAVHADGAGILNVSASAPDAAAIAPAINLLPHLECFSVLARQGFDRRTHLDLSGFRQCGNQRRRVEIHFRAHEMAPPAPGNSLYIKADMHMPISLSGDPVQAFRSSQGADGKRSWMPVEREPEVDPRAFI